MTLRIRKAIKNKSFYFPAVKFIMPIRNKTWYGFHKKFKKIILKKTLSWNRNPLNAGGESSNLSSENKLAGILLTSCGGTSKDTVLRSTHLKWSIQGITKNIPGPWKVKSKNTVIVCRYWFFVNFLIIIIYNNMYLCPSLPQAAQSEYHSPFIFLDNLQQIFDSVKMDINRDAYK